MGSPSSPKAARTSSKSDHRAPRDNAAAAILDELLFDRAVLRDCERTRARPELVAERPKRSDRKILEFVSGDLDLFAECAQCIGSSRLRG